MVVTGRHFSSAWEADTPSTFKMRIKTFLLYKVGIDFPELLVNLRPITTHLVFPHFTIFSYYSPVMHSINFFKTFCSLFFLALEDMFGPTLLYLTFFLIKAIDEDYVTIRLNPSLFCWCFIAFWLRMKGEVLRKILYL